MLTKVSEPKFKIQNVEFRFGSYQLRIKKMRFWFWNSVSKISSSDRTLFLNNFQHVLAHLAAKDRFGDKYSAMAYIKDDLQINISIYRSLLNHVKATKL
jgi:hypothetical protein